MGERWPGARNRRLPQHPRSSPGGLDAEEVLPSGLPPTFVRFTHHSYAQMVRVLRRTAARCAHIAKTYSIGRSFNGKELLVIEFSARPGQHELSKPGLLSLPEGEVRGWAGFWQRALGLPGLGCASPGAGSWSRQGWGGGERGAGSVCALLGAPGRMATWRRVCGDPRGRWELRARPRGVSVGEKRSDAPVRLRGEVTGLRAFCGLGHLALQGLQPGPRHVRVALGPEHFTLL